jgi:putative membrane protein
MRDLLVELPVINAIFNGITAVCLLAGFWAIKTGRRQLHRTLMLSAFASAALFLAGYLVHTFTTGNTLFPGHGAWRSVYLGLLFSHMILAVVVLPLILRTLYLAWFGHYSRHRRIAIWTWPVWVYVSVTGVLVYLMLFRLPVAWLAASAIASQP